MLVLELLILLLLGAVLAPDSFLGRWLIRTPAQILARMTPRSALLGLLGFVFFLALLASGPELWVLFGVADLSMIADVTALLFVAGASARFGAVKRVAVTLVHRVVLVLRRATRQRRPRIARPRRRPTRDEPGPGPAWAFA